VGRDGHVLVAIGSVYPLKTAKRFGSTGRVVCLLHGCAFEMHRDAAGILHDHVQLSGVGKLTHTRRLFIADHAEAKGILRSPREDDIHHRNGEQHEEECGEEEFCAAGHPLFLIGD
jgi:hypothetical protein